MKENRLTERIRFCAVYPCPQGRENDPRAKVNRSNVNLLRLKVFFTKPEAGSECKNKKTTGCHGDFPELSHHCLNFTFLLAQSIFNYFHDI